ncbi:MAG: PqqD family protein [Deltaproteobacteria bacterium]|nr:PqqD family protein [Deltaproteobacteria bacterium]
MPSPSDPLDLRPVRARADERGDDGLLSIRVPRFEGWLARLLGPRLRRPDFLLRLDAVGTAVWEMCDGARTGHQIAAALASRFPDLAKAEGRTRAFLGLLIRQGHVRPVR